MDRLTSGFYVHLWWPRRWAISRPRLSPSPDIHRVLLGCLWYDDDKSRHYLLADHAISRPHGTWAMAVCSYPVSPSCLHISLREELWQWASQSPAGILVSHRVQYRTVWRPQMLHKWDCVSDHLSKAPTAPSI